MFALRLRATRVPNLLALVLGGSVLALPCLVEAAAVTLEDASNVGIGHTGYANQIVRTSGGILYIAYLDSASCEIWRSTDEGATWAEQDASNNPAMWTGTGSSCVSAIDSNNVIHLVYGHDTNDDIYYVTFATSTNTFGTPEAITGSDRIGRGLDLAVDSNNIPHVVHANADSTVSVYYSNRVGGSWDATPVTIQSEGNDYISLSITINEDNIPEIGYVDRTSSDITAAVGDQNDAASFTVQDVDTSIIQNKTNSPNIIVDDLGNTWMTYLDETGASDYITLVKHNDADAWSSWQTPVNNSNVGQNPSIIINGSIVYLIYVDVNDDIVYDRYAGSTWSGPTVLETGTYSGPSARSASLNNFGSYGIPAPEIDYIFDDGNDLFYNKLILHPGDFFNVFD